VALLNTIINIDLNLLIIKFLIVFNNLIINVAISLEISIKKTLLIFFNVSLFFKTFKKSNKSGNGIVVTIFSVVCSSLSLFPKKVYFKVSHASEKSSKIKLILLLIEDQE